MDRLMDPAFLGYLGLAIALGVLLWSAYFVVASWRLALWRAENAEEAMEAADGIVDDLWQRIEDCDEERKEALRESADNAAALKRAAKVAGARRRRGEFLWLVAGSAVLARDGAVREYNVLLAAYRPLLKEHLELKKAHSLLQLFSARSAAYCVAYRRRAEGLLAGSREPELGSVLQAVDASSRAESGRGGAVYTQSAAMRLAEGALVRRGMQAPAIIDGDNPLGGDKPTSQWATGEREALLGPAPAWLSDRAAARHRRHGAAATTAADAEVKDVAKRAVAKRAEPKPELPAWRDGWGGHDPDATDGGTEAALVAGVPNTGEFDTRIVQVDDLKVLSPLGPLAAVEPKKGQQPVSPPPRADLVALGHILAPQLAPLPGDQT